MKPNLKSLGGFVVLSYNASLNDGEPITFETYKTRTGIDLHEIFVMGENYPQFKPECKKPIYISQDYDRTTPMVSPIVATYSSPDDHELWLIPSMGIDGDLKPVPYLYIRIIQDDGDMLILGSEN